jgi:hypothetical protein
MNSQNGIDRQLTVLLMRRFIMKNNGSFKAVEDLSPKAVYYSALSFALMAKFGYDYGKTGTIDFRGPHLFENPVLDLGVKLAFGVGLALVREQILQKIEKLQTNQQVGEVLSDHPEFRLNLP